MKLIDKVLAWIDRFNRETDPGWSVVIIAALAVLVLSVTRAEAATTETLMQACTVTEARVLHGKDPTDAVGWSHTAFCTGVFNGVRAAVVGLVSDFKGCASMPSSNALIVSWLKFVRENPETWNSHGETLAAAWVLNAVPASCVTPANPTDQRPRSRSLLM